MAQNVDGPYEQSLDSGATCLSSSSNQGPQFGAEYYMEYRGLAD